MKKFIKVCLIIIILGIIINVVIIVNRRSSATNKDKNSESENKGEIVVIGKDESQNSSTDYYSIYREKLDRPILYTIGNTPDALPQSGIYGADFIYEIKAEGGLTRLLAIFERGNVSKIGPIRSASIIFWIFRWNMMQFFLILVEAQKHFLIFLIYQYQV